MLFNSFCSASTLLPPLHAEEQKRCYSHLSLVLIGAPCWVWDGLCWWQDELSPRKAVPGAELADTSAVYSLLRVPWEERQWNTPGNVPGHGAAAALLWGCRAVKTARLCSLAPPQHCRGIFLEMHFKVLVLMGVTDTQFVWKQDKLLGHALGTAFGWCLQLLISDYFDCRAMK